MEQIINDKSNLDRVIKADKTEQAKVDYWRQKVAENLRKSLEQAQKLLDSED